MQRLGYYDKLSRTDFPPVSEDSDPYWTPICLFTTTTEANQGLRRHRVAPGTLAPERNALKSTDCHAKDR